MKCRAGDKLPSKENIEKLKEVMNDKYKNLINIGVLNEDIRRTVTQTLLG